MAPYLKFVPIWWPNIVESCIRKSKDYVYGIWMYKALDVWKGYYRVKKSLVSYVKPWTEVRNNKYMKYHSKLTYQLSFWNVSRKVDYHAGGKWFIHGPKRRKENQLLSLKHPRWLSLVVLNFARLRHSTRRTKKFFMYMFTIYCKYSVSHYTSVTASRIHGSYLYRSQLPWRLCRQCQELLPQPWWYWPALLHEWQRTGRLCA